MTQDEIIDMAKQSNLLGVIDSFHYTNRQTWIEEATAFAKLVAEKEREVVANWIMDRGFATGHGDSIVDLLDQLEWQIIDRARGQA